MTKPVSTSHIDREVMIDKQGVEQLELRIWRAVADRHLSVSHDRWHIDRVLNFARQLHSIYGGDQSVISAAAILHDLGRSNPELRGQASVAESVRQAKQVLEDVEFPPAKVERVLLAISEHDKPELRPSSVEGRILKDADYLAGFGAWGILRVAMWSGETQSGIPQILDRLQHRMLRRLEALEYPESIHLAKKEMLFVNLFLEHLGQPPHLETRCLPGTYVVLEGISGSGKDTQARLLSERLAEVSRNVVLVNEPTDRYRKARGHWGRSSADPVVQMFLLLADRYELTRQRVVPALSQGSTVVSVRSFISTLVYQRNELYATNATAFLHSFVPTPDLAILLDLNAQTAHERCITRAETQDQASGDYEAIVTLQEHRQRYLDVINEMPTWGFRVVDASRSVKQVSETIWKSVEERIG